MHFLRRGRHSLLLPGAFAAATPVLFKFSFMDEYRLCSNRRLIRGNCGPGFELMQLVHRAMSKFACCNVGLHGTRRRNVLPTNSEFYETLIL